VSAWCFFAGPHCLAISARMSWNAAITAISTLWV
jgi:hypothetical protein